LDIPNVLGLSMVLARRVSVDEATALVELESSVRQSGVLITTAKVAAPLATNAPATKAARQPGPSRPAGESAGLWSGGSGTAPVLRVLPSGPIPPNPGEMIASQRFVEVIASLRDEADLVVVDAPAMLPVGDTAAIARAVDGLVYVVNPERVRRPVLQQARAQLGHLPCTLLGIIEVADRKGQGQYSGYYDHSDDGSGLRRGR
jgi:Mrp family chromosome partitioning ATPase